MAKNKDRSEHSEETARINDSAETAGYGTDDGELKRAGGFIIARWKQQVFAELPDGDDQTIASRLNQIALDEGYDYRCTPAIVSLWRKVEPNPPMNGETVSNGQEEGHAYVILRQLVHLLSKNAVKKLIDSL